MSWRQRGGGGGKERSAEEEWKSAEELTKEREREVDGPGGRSPKGDLSFSPSGDAAEDNSSCCLLVSRCRFSFLGLAFAC